MIPYADTVVPKCNIIFPPLKSDMKLLGGCENLIKVVDDSVALRLGHANNLGHETRVEEH